MQAGFGSEEKSLVVRSTATGNFQQVTPYLKDGRYAFAGASTDDSKLFFEAEGKGINLTGNAATGKDNLYLYEPATEELSLVGVLPPSQGGHAPAGGSFAGPFDWWHKYPSTSQLSFGGAMGGPSEVPGEYGYVTQSMHTIAADGDKAFFTAGLTGQIYMRGGLDSEEPETVQVSGSQRSVLDPNGAKPAVFMDATPSGSKAFFASCEKLTDDSTAHSNGEDTCLSANQGQDLYAYDTASHHLEDLTVDTEDPQGAEVKGVVGISNDGSIVYFVANGDLDGDGPGQAGDCQGSASGSGFEFHGTCNLYAWVAGSISFVAPLDTAGAEVGSDAADWEPAGGGFGGGHPATGRVSADGQTVVFRSQLPLTGYDSEVSDNFQCGKSGQLVCPEFFRYHLGDAGLSCVSCTPSGAPPLNGGPTIQSIETAPFVPVHPIESRFLSASGNQVYFETPEKLVSSDTNGDSSCPRRPARIGVLVCQDVYEWEAAGAGSCTEASSAFSPANGGCLYLLSSGTSPDPSYYGDASSSGDDVFILTTSQLVPGDQDHLYDFYDARVGGGLAAQNQSSSVPCEGEACRQAGSTPPTVQSAGSASFSVPSGPPDKHKKPKKHHKKSKGHKHKHRQHHVKKRASSHAGGSK